jgi:uncharacterized protein
LRENMNIQESMLEKKIWAVIGANNDPDKFGNIIYKRLKSEGYTVYPVNPMYEEVEGDPCYPDLESLPLQVLQPSSWLKYGEDLARLTM